VSRITLLALLALAACHDEPPHVFQSPAPRAAAPPQAAPLAVVQGEFGLHSPAARLESVVAQYRDHLPDRFVLHLDIQPTCTVSADPTRLEQVLINLLTNAVKYSPDAGTITLRVNPADAGVRVDVADQGIGLLPDRLERIFEPFARAPSAAARQIPGMGLGLHISHQIVEQHGGRIWAASAGEGKGSTFSMWLPCAEAHD